MKLAEAKEWLRGERSTVNYTAGETPWDAQERAYRQDAACTEQAYWIVKAHEELDLKPFERPKCVVCGEEQTDLIYISMSKFHVGFPVCDDHDLGDLKPDQYVMNNLLVEVH